MPISQPYSKPIGYFRGEPWYLTQALLGQGIQLTVAGRSSGTDLVAGTTCDVDLNGFFPSDFFNEGWVLMAIDCTNITTGTVKDITDFVTRSAPTLDLITTLSMGASWAAGDKICLFPASMFGTPDKIVLTRPASTLPQADDLTLFTGTGSMKLTITGKITTAIGAVANATLLRVDQGAVATDICASVEMNAAAVDSGLTITGTFANAMVINTADTPLTGEQADPVRVIENSSDSWTIVLECAGESGTGAIEWSVVAEPLSTDASLVIA